MPKDSRSMPKVSKNAPAISSQALYLLWPKIWQNTFEMVFNNRTHGLSDIFLSFLTISDWSFDFLKMTNNGNFLGIFQFESTYLKNNERYPKTHK